MNLTIFYKFIILFLIIIISNCGGSPYFDPFDMETGRVSIATVKATNDLLNNNNTIQSPSYISASKGTSSSYVYLEWASVDKANKYKIYRSTKSNENYIYITTTSYTDYKDYSAASGYLYYYKVTAIDENGNESSLNLAPYDSGYKYFSLSAPSGVSASDGTYMDKIEITWYSVYNASSYKIYRSTSSYGTYYYIGTTTSTYFSDTNVTSGTNYYYKIKAVSAGGIESDFSSYDSGYSLLYSYAPPQNLTASQGAYYNYVFLIWDSVQNASYYHIYRSSDGENFEYINYTYNNYYYDYTYNTYTYYYKVKAYINNYGWTDFSDIVSGWASY